MKQDVNYGRQRENKLMFFLYVLKEKGMPVSRVFEKEIKDIQTQRFSVNFDDDYGALHLQLSRERHLNKLSQFK